MSTLNLELVVQLGLLCASMPAPAPEADHSNRIWWAKERSLQFRHAHHDFITLEWFGSQVKLHSTT